MSDSILVALISAGASSLVSITALLLGYRGFVSIDGRFVSLENRLVRIEQRIDDLTGAVNDLDKRLIKVEIKLGITP